MGFHSSGSEGKSALLIKIPLDVPPRKNIAGKGFGGPVAYFLALHAENRVGCTIARQSIFALISRYIASANVVL